MVFACGDFFTISPSLGQITVWTVVSLPKLSSVKIAARWCSVLVRGVGPDQSEARDDTRLCPGSGPRFYPQIAPQLPAWRRGNTEEYVRTRFVTLGVTDGRDYAASDWST